jgi:hypothetical protein
MMMMIFGAIGGMNLAGETEVLGGNLPRRHFVHHTIPHDYRSRTPDRSGRKPATNRLSYGAAIKEIERQKEVAGRGCEGDDGNMEVANRHAK